MGKGMMKALSCKYKSDLKLEMYQRQARYFGLKFGGKAFFSFEGLCGGVLFSLFIYARGTR